MLLMIEPSLAPYKAAPPLRSQEQTVLTRLVAALLILSSVLCSLAFAQGVPKGEAAFTEYVAAQVRRAIRGATIEVKGPLTLQVGELQANLDRIFIFCNKNAAGCPNEIANYVKGVAQVYHDRTAPPSKAAVR